MSLIVSASAAFGGVKAGTFSVSPLVGGYIYDDEQHLDSTLVMGLRAGYNFTKNFGIEALYDYADTTDTSAGAAGTSLHRFGGQALYHFFPDSVFVPYLAAGFSGVRVSGSGKNVGAFDYGVGAKYFLAEDFAIRGDIRQIIYRFNQKSFENIEYTIGAYVQFGAVAPAMKAVAPAPEPAKTVAAPAPAPAPVPAPAAAAPVVVAPVIVAPVVIPPADSDRDGVIDALDKCPGTPAGVAVDSNGCPIDSDRDGVADYLDKCLGTPAGVVVDAKGCPVDSDNDGVADYLDKCPGTPAGVAVSTNGCPVEAAKKFCDKPAVIAVSFDTNKSDLKAKNHDELDKLGTFLKEFPNSKGTIEGHTDADGNKAANLKLSQARADSVRNYIITKFGIDSNRLSSKGYGSDKPVAPNKTASDKAKNRRIEALFSCE